MLVVTQAFLPPPDSRLKMGRISFLFVYDAYAISIETFLNEKKQIIIITNEMNLRCMQLDILMSNVQQFNHFVSNEIKFDFLISF